MENTSELAGIQAEITGRLGIGEDQFWPHVTLGVAREDFPASKATSMSLPSSSEAAPSLDMQQELSATSFRVLVRRELG
ncbi:hypothetical protein [Streptomyces sp. ISL-100]|uniref:hypothetical protein n=1 Tax=Streptomyces sp. ISL-100 TaxID=2819173 RepID=UPI001BEBCB94|nr:hypothetical protein [Streptomyces sp. ISL-100]MBT2399817.1 hypothetical protein [Streptomyces sp. ISL-100]